MAEVPNARVIDRYRELLAQRTHDVIVRDEAIKILEEEVVLERERKEKYRTDHEQVTNALNRANETIRLLQDKINETENPVIQGEVVKKDK